MLRRLTDVSALKDVAEVLPVRRLLREKRRERQAQGGGSDEEVHLSVGRRQAGTDLVLRSQVSPHLGLGGSRCLKGGGMAAKVVALGQRG